MQPSLQLSLLLSFGSAIELRSSVLRASTSTERTQRFPRGEAAEKFTAFLALVNQILTGAKRRPRRIRPRNRERGTLEPMICASASSLLRRNGSMFRPLPRSLAAAAVRVAAPSETTSVWRSPKRSPRHVLRAAGRLTDDGRRDGEREQEVRPSAPRATERIIRLN